MAERAQLKRGIRKEGKEIGLTDAQVKDMTRYALAWHGSKADFDKFDSSKRFTGEGAMVHGSGHYVAVKKGTAEHYAHRKYSRFGYELEPEGYVYQVEIPDNNGSNYIEESADVPANMLKEIRNEFIKTYTENIDELEAYAYDEYWVRDGIIDDYIKEEFAQKAKRKASRMWRLYVKDEAKTFKDVMYLYNEYMDNSSKGISDVFADMGYVGVHYDGSSDGECYVIFDGDNIKIKGKERYALAPEKKDRDEMFRNISSDGFTDLTLRQINDFIDKSHNGEERFKISPRVRDGYGQEGGRRDVNLDTGLILSRLAEGAASKTDRAVQEVAYRRIMQAYHSMLEEWAKATNNWYEYSGLGKLIKSYEYVSGTDSDVFESVNPGFVVKLSKGKPTKKNFRPDRDSTAIFNDVFKNTQYKVLGYGMDENGNFVSILEQKAVNAESQATHDEIEEYMKSKGFSRRGSFGDTYESRDYIIADLKGGNVLKTKSGVVVIDADCLYNTPDRRGEHNIPKIETDFAGGKVPEFTRFSLVTPKQDSEYRKAYEDGDKEKAMTILPALRAASLSHSTRWLRRRRRRGSKEVQVQVQGIR